jgi:hypothetical protein
MIGGESWMDRIHDLATSLGGEREGTLARSRGLEGLRPMTQSRNTKTLEMFLIDVLRHGQGGQLKSILSRLNSRGCIGWRDHWSHDFSVEEIAPVLKDLAIREILEVAIVQHGASKWKTVKPTDELFRDSLNDLWFFMTEKAYKLWDEWEPPAERSGTDTDEGGGSDPPRRSG